MQNFGQSKTEGERQAIGYRGQIVGQWKGGKTIEQIHEGVGCAQEKFRIKISIFSSRFSNQFYYEIVHCNLLFI